MDKELSYWLTLTHAPKIRTKKKNDIIVKLFNEKSTLSEFFTSSKSEWSNHYNLDSNEIEILIEVSTKVSNYAFMAEDLIEQGFKILPITSEDYSPQLKKNLGRSYAPPLLYAKGNLNILKEKSIAIVGSRKASSKALEFTDNVALKASKEYKVIVSGFAKGVDKKALDSALNYKGQSIIVLPQGIGTFTSGYKKYYKQIVEGDVLVVSTFYPKAPWSVQLAMARNPIIYGLASEIYVAESSDSGGTWSGVIDGLRKNRTIYVRQSTPKEKNANNLLISKGAVPVDMQGSPLDDESKSDIPQEEKTSNSIDENQILQLLKNGEYTSRSIISKLDLKVKPRVLTMELKKNKDIVTIKGNPLKFTHKSGMPTKQGKLF